MGAGTMIIRSAGILSALPCHLDRLMATAEHESDAVCVTDLNGIIVYVNPAFEALTGFSKDSALGCPASLSNAGLTPKETFRELWAMLKEGRVVRCEFVNRRRDGSVYQESKIIRPFFDAKGRMTYYVSQGWRSEAGENLMERLAFLALHDPLTLLPNRNYFMERSQLELSLAQRSGQGMAICFMDIDAFKSINDGYGHAAGDETLKRCAVLLQRSLREVDFVARLGGDEFAVLLWNVSDRLDVARILDRLLVALQRSSKDVAHGSINLSIGVALFPECAMDVGRLLHRADRAMYQVKARGGAGYAFAEIEEGRGNHQSDRFPIHPLGFAEHHSPAAMGIHTEDYHP